MVLHVFRIPETRNRFYVVDNNGNKLFHGTIYQCGKFLDYMLKGEGPNVEAFRKPVGAVDDQACKR